MKQHQSIPFHSIRALVLLVIHFIIAEQGECNGVVNQFVRVLGNYVYGY